MKPRTCSSRVRSSPQTWLLVAGTANSELDPDSGTTAFQQEHISPSVPHLSQTLSYANLAKSARLVQRDAGPIFREDSGLQRPDTVDFRFVNKGIQQQLADATTAGSACDVHGTSATPA